MFTRIGPLTLCKAWSTDISNTSLTFTNTSTTAKRAGSVSTYPAAFANLQAEHSKITVRLDATPRNGNWLTFGVAKRGMAVSGSDGMGRTKDSWGVADDHGSSSTANAIVSASGTNVGTLSRKLKQNDVLSAEVNVAAGWCEVRLNQTEFTHRFTIPVGAKEDYWFGMTFASDVQVTVLPSDVAPPPVPAAPRTAVGVCLGLCCFV